MQHPSLEIRAEGEWLATQAGSRTRVRAVSKIPRLGVALARLGYAEQIADGQADLTLNLSWDGSPGQFRYATLDGDFQLDARKGRFLQLDPGSGGRLMGLFNIEALERRLTLDFSDIFSKGMSFDTIKGEGTIRDGDLLSDGVYLIGPAALIETRGRAGLAVEDFDMEVTVAPQVGGNLSLLGALANPAAGAVIFIVQKVFKKQLAKAVHYRYHVTGSWDEPSVEPTGVEEQQAEPVPGFLLESESES